jgi:hypothetical protein
VNGDPSHVGGTDDAPDQEGGAELLPAMFELVTQYPRRQRVSTNPAAIAFTLIGASSRRRSRRWPVLERVEDDTAGGYRT